MEQPQPQVQTEGLRKLHVSGNKKQPGEELRSPGMRTSEPVTGTSEGQEGPAGILVISFLCLSLPAE